jgi:broad specificity phosphatase PhoE
VAILHLVRHGQASAGWNEHADPGLTEKGRAQAEAVAIALEPFGPMPILTSTLLRCQETAAPLAKRWGVDVVVEPRVAEVPTPDGLTVADRGPWLHTLLAGRWSTEAPELEWWRQAVVDRLLAIDTDTVVFTHFVAINVAIGAANGDDTVVIAHPDNCSVTTMTNVGGELLLVDAPAQATTEVL